MKIDAQVRSVIGATTIDPELLTAAERIQYEGYLRREETNAAILELSKSGMAIKQIARQTGLMASMRLCAYYRLDQQAVAGWMLILIAVVLGALWFVAALIGWPRRLGCSPR